MSAEVRRQQRARLPGTDAGIVSSQEHTVCKERRRLRCSSYGRKRQTIVRRKFRAETYKTLRTTPRIQACGPWQERMPDMTFGPQLFLTEHYTTRLTSGHQIW